jgi:glycosyltransferase involved in cell wall biosynthesis
MKTLIIHNEGPDLNFETCSGTGYQILKMNKLFDFVAHVDESNVNSSYIKKYNNAENNIIFVTRALRYIDYFNKPKKIYWSHNYYIPEGVNVRKVFDKVVGVSVYHQLWLTKKFKKLSHCIYNTYNYNVSDVGLRDYSNLSIAFVGSLNENKGFTNFVNIAKDIGIKSQNCTVKIFGEGEKSNLIKTLTVFNNLKVEYYGKQPKEVIHKELSQTLFLLYGLNESGAAETFGLSFLDAQMNGCIPLTINRGASYEIIEKSIQKFSICKSNKEIISKLISYQNYDLLNYSRKLKLNSCFANSFSSSKFRCEWERLLFSNLYPKYRIDYIYKYSLREFF